MEKSRKTILHTVMCIVLIALIWGGYFIVAEKVELKGKAEIINEQKQVLDYDVLAQIENIGVEDNDIVLEGWVLRMESTMTDIYVVLHPESGNNDIVLSSEYEKRDEITERIDNEWDFGKCGFSTHIKSKKLNPEMCYEVLLSLVYRDSNGIEREEKVTTNKYMRSGEMYSYNPTKFVTPDVDESMQVVIDEGEVKAYDVEKGTWLYQYDSTLYWIINVQLFGDLSERPEIPVFFMTYDASKLPEERQKYKSGYFGRYLNEADYQNMTDKYFVCSCEIPREYPITYIQTGVCFNESDRGWEWKTTIMNVIFN